MHKPEHCGKCGAKAQERKRCPQCGEAEWVIEHGAHYMGGAREVIVCGCPAPHSALGRRRQAIEARAAAREAAGLRANWNKPVTTPEMAKKAAKGLLKGLTATAALREAGYPANTVHHSKSAINKMIRAELRAMGGHYIKLGKDLTPEDQEALVRGRLMENTIIGTDKGVLSAKQLGSDKRISMWRPDSQVGLVVLQAPPIPKIDHEVPWIESKAAQERRKKEEVEDDSR